MGIKFPISYQFTYRDLVAVDIDMGLVTRIAAGFVNPLDTLADEDGNILKADWRGSIFRIEAANPVTEAHPFTWDSDSDGNFGNSQCSRNDTERNHYLSKEEKNGYQKSDIRCNGSACLLIAGIGSQGFDSKEPCDDGWGDRHK